VTTQHTQQEHDDVDATVVQYPSTPEASVDPIASETTTPTEVEEQVSTSSTEPGASIPEVTPEASDETAAPAPSPVEEPAQSAETAPVEESEGDQEEQTPLAEASVEEETSTPEAPVTEAVHVEFPYQDVLSFTKESENEVRPFTAFIEEFRLAEEQARRQISLPETPMEVAHLLPTVNDLSAPTQEEVSTQEIPAPAAEGTATAEEEVIVEEQAAPVAASSASEITAEAAQALTEVLGAMQAEVLEEPKAESSEELKAEAPAESQEGEAKVEAPAEVKAESEAPVTSAVETGEPQQLAAPVEPEKVEAISSETPTAESSVPTPPAPERAVSPLLRPASPRVRSSRHARHLREEPAVEAPTEKPAQPAEPQTPAATKAGQSATTEPATTPLVEQVGQQTAPAEPLAPPRPARRYRFDRPAASNNGTAPAASTRSEENKETLSRSSSTVASEQTAEPATKAASKSVQTEQPASKQQESSAQETQSAAPETTGRRRGHDRHKETAAATPATPPVVEPVNPVVEPAPMQLEEIAPEDLPPLEYAELQKTSTTRRRRRHRSSAANGNGATTAATPTETPAAPTPATSPLGGVPVVPATPPAAPSQPAASAQTNGAGYSIVSGYTVSQMNQGNDTTGPFMGPDPSPARGSVLSRDGRTVNRAETQRTPTPLYPGRSHGHEGGLTTAAFNQLTNSLVQALQNQTDRMVAELRRTNAAPTNVSVSLPPFPSTERVGVFVDVANLLYSARTLRISVDFGKLLDFLRGNRRLVRAHAYCPTSPQAGDEQMFLQAVKGLGYRITTKNYKTFSSGAKKADLDLDLCMDVVRLVDGRAVDCIVLVSGDSDFMPMLDYCSDHGVRVEVAAFDEAMSATLRQSCDLFVNLSMLEEIRS
jgi:uncharacterized LabA/DUF88 family protein